MENEKEGEMKEEAGFKWSWGKFFKGKCSNKFIAFLCIFVLVTWVMASGLIEKLSMPFEIGLISLLAATTIIFMLSGSIDTAVENAKLTLELKAGMQKTISTDTARVIEAVKNLPQ